jgi:hypothetical protein
MLVGLGYRRRLELGWQIRALVLGEIRSISGALSEDGSIDELNGGDSR